MSVHRQCRFVVAVAAVTVGMAGWAGNRAAAQEIGEPPGQFDQEGMEYLNRGVIHEAFAEPYSADPVESMVISQRPPEPIDELPPEARPEGDNVVWIPGYWAWEPDRENFIWVSGVWRDVPPDQRWVPGYWTEADRGWQWVPGFWTSIEAEQLSYYPTPPDSLEQGPVVEAPTEAHFWVPGVWMWIENDYRWRPGYWAVGYDDWVWVPDRWIWTPGGCFFVDGYWDYRLPARGVLFAPVYFEQHVFAPGFVYQPTVVIDVEPLLVHLFVWPQYHHYYFGDYYAQTYVDYGIRPWVDYYAGPRHYDPLLTYYRWHYSRRGGIDFVARIQGWHNYFVRNPDFRPRRTFRAQQNFITQVQNNEITVNQNIVNQVVISQSLNNVVERNRNRFVNVDRDRRERFVSTARQLRELQQGRRRSEVAAADFGRGEGRRPADGERDRGEARRAFRLPNIAAFELPEAQPERDRDERTRDQARPPERPGRSPRLDRGDDVARPGRPGADQRDDMEPGRDDRPDRTDDLPGRRIGRPDRDDRPGRNDEVGRPGRPDAEDRIGRGRPDRGERPDFTRPEDDRPDLPDFDDRPGTRPDRDEPGMRPDRGARPDFRPGQLPGLDDRDRREGRPDPRLPGARRDIPGLRPDIPGRDDRPDTRIPGLRPDADRGRDRPGLDIPGTRPDTRRPERSDAQTPDARPESRFPGLRPGDDRGRDGRTENRTLRPDFNIPGLGGSRPEAGGRPDAGNRPDMRGRDRGAADPRSGRPGLQIPGLGRQQPDAGRPDGNRFQPNTPTTRPNLNIPGLGGNQPGRPGGGRPDFGGRGAERPNLQIPNLNRTPGAATPQPRNQTPNIQIPQQRPNIQLPQQPNVSPPARGTPGAGPQGTPPGQGEPRGRGRGRDRERGGN